MTDDLRRPDDRDDEIDLPVGAGREDAHGDDDEVGAETDVETGGAILARTGADAPDAADIEDPERQL